MSTPKIRNLESLESEIYRLKLRQKEIEHNLDKNILGLRHSAGSMAWNSIMHSGVVQGVVSGNFWANLAYRLLQNKKLQDGISKLVDKVTEKIGEGIDKVTSKLHP